MSALRLVVDDLACPICMRSLTTDGDALACTNGHSFDVARQGYASLVTGSGAHVADTAAMVEARETFLAAGHYGAIADGVARALRAAGLPSTDGESGDGLIVDLAGGTGYYAARAMDTFLGGHGRGLVIDLSKFALRRAARAHDRIAAVAANVWSAIPVRDGAASAVLSIFGPRNPDEIERILAPGGVLVVVTPTDTHLVELRSALGLMAVDARKPVRLAAQLANFDALNSSPVDYRLELPGDDVFTAAMMGPNAFHRDPDEMRERIDALADPFAVTVSVQVSTYRPR